MGPRRVSLKQQQNPVVQSELPSLSETPPPPFWPEKGGKILATDRRRSRVGTTREGGRREEEEEEGEGLIEKAEGRGGEERRGG